MPKISIIVPVYKVEPYLKRCVDSILHQTFTDFECILVDDGSPDNCPDICDEYARKDKRIRVVHKENGGLSDARNAGLDIAQGEYIGFVDGDDYIHPQTYEIMLKAMSSAKAEIGCLNYTFIQPNEEEKFCRYNINNIIENMQVIDSNMFLEQFDKYFRAVSWISACTKLYRRDVFENNRYPYGKTDEDSYMLHHVIAECSKVVRIEVPLYYYVWTAGSISRSEFSAKRFDKNGANIDRVKFFEKKGIKKQAAYFKREYLLNTLQMYYKVKNEYPEFLCDYKKCLSEYKTYLREFVKDNDDICNMEKLIYNLFSVSPMLAERLYNKFLK